MPDQEANLASQTPSQEPYKDSRPKGRYHRNMKPRRGRGMSPIAVFMLSVTVALVSFVAGTRSTQILAVVGPIFGVQTSSDTIDTTLLQRTYQSLEAKFDGPLDKDKLSDGAIRGMVAAAGDKYTVFMSADEAHDFENELNGNLSGIGCEIGVRNDQPTVIRVLSDSPAEKSGVMVGDVFVVVNGESVVGKDPSVVANLVRGEDGTTVKIKFSRSGSEHEVSVTRAKINDPSVRWTVNDGVGILTITRFDGETVDLARTAADDFVSHGVKGVILDLRNNGGGYLDAAQGVASLWLKDKLIVSEKHNGQTVDSIYSNGQATLEGMKTVLLVNGASASASEIVAGALQDYKAATLLGEKTYGKGSVQEVVSLPGDRVLKVTIARWYTPNDKNINEQGIKPDKEVKLTADDANKGADPQLNAALDLLR